MALPPNYTLIPWRGGMAKDGNRYKVCGNSIVTAVLNWIGRRIADEMERSKVDPLEIL
jgi:DNA (cytosine-5)-methyltransferase 1